MARDQDAGPATLAIVGGRVVPVAGPALSEGTVLIRDGRIEAVGSDLAIPADAEIVDASGRWVLPGFVESHAHVGVHEESSGSSGDDTNESATPVTAGIRALDGINVADPGFSDALLGGITTVVVKPGSSNPFGGQSVAIKTGGGPTVDSRILSTSTGVKSALGENPKSVHGAAGRSPVTRMGVAMVIRQALSDARRAVESGEGGVDLHGEALAALLRGDLAWDVHAHRHDDIATAMRIAEEFGLRLVINHGTEGYRLPGEIAARDHPVILGPLFSARSKVELAGHRTTTAAVLHEAGVTLALTTDHPEVPIQLLAVQAAYAVREGLPRDAALRAITETPASIYGLGERVGSLAPGRDGDVVIWSGDPFDAQSRVERVYIDGREVHARLSVEDDTDGTHHEGGRT